MGSVIVSARNTICYWTNWSSQLTVRTTPDDLLCVVAVRCVKYTELPTLRSTMRLYLDEVPRAVIRACSSPAMKVKGFFLVTTKKSSGRTNRPWMRSPAMTETVYIPNCPPTWARSFISTIFPAIRKRIPTGAYLLRRDILQQLFHK